jgi:hypothetical protein
MMKALPVQKSGLFQTGSSNSLLAEPVRASNNQVSSHVLNLCFLPGKSLPCRLGYFSKLTQKRWVWSNRRSPIFNRKFEEHSPSSVKNQHKTNTFLTPPRREWRRSRNVCGSSLFGRTYRAVPVRKHTKPDQNQIISNTDPQGGLILILILSRGATEPRGEKSVQNPYSTHAKTPLL